jgi:hypothetical protein
VILEFFNKHHGPDGRFTSGSGWDLTTDGTGKPWPGWMTPTNPLRLATPQTINATSTQEMLNGEVGDEHDSSGAHTLAKKYVGGRLADSALSTEELLTAAKPEAAALLPLVGKKGTGMLIAEDLKTPQHIQDVAPHQREWYVSLEDEASVRQLAGRAISERYMSQWARQGHGSPETADMMDSAGRLYGAKGGNQASVRDYETGNSTPTEQYLAGRSPTHVAVADQTAKAIYEHTQATLSTIGVKEIPVYRGYQTTTSPEVGSRATLGQSSLSSWTTVPDIAAEYAQQTGGVVLAYKVPASEVFSLGTTGVGRSQWAEVVPLNTESPAVIHSKA